MLGDSLSAAYNISWESGWVNLLRQHFRQTAKPITVINASVGGATTQNGLQRLPKLLAEHKPDIVIIELGANDGLQGKPVPYITQNLRQLITLSKQSKASVILVGNRLPPNLGKRYTEPFFNQYAHLAESEKTLLLPFMLKDIAGNPELMQADGLHPKVEAQPQIMQYMLPLIEQALRE